jgi:hypothetical protein
MTYAVCLYVVYAFLCLYFNTKQANPKHAHCISRGFLFFLQCIRMFGLGCKYCTRSIEATAQHITKTSQHITKTSQHITKTSQKHHKNMN